MDYPAEYSHGGKQLRLVVLVSRMLNDGEVTVECPISTSEGVKVADVAWVSKSRLAKIGGAHGAESGAGDLCRCDLAAQYAQGTRGEAPVVP